MRLFLACCLALVVLTACEPSIGIGSGGGGGGGDGDAPEESAKDPVFQNRLSAVLPAAAGMSFACTIDKEAIALRLLSGGRLEASAFEETHEGTWSPGDTSITLSVPTLALIEESGAHQLAFDLLVGFESARLRCGAVSTKVSAPSWAIAACPSLDTSAGVLEQGFAFGTDGGVIWRRVVAGSLSDRQGVYRTAGTRAFLAFPGAMDQAHILTGTLLDDGISFDALDGKRRSCKTPTPAQ